MKRRNFIITASASLATPLIASPAFARKRRFLEYDGPPVTRVVVYKERRQLYLLSQLNILETYQIDLGTMPVGHKQFEGDGKTPEGSYLIDRRNDRSAFHLSLGISYPNAQDKAFASARNRSPGGEIFIHGRAGQHIGKGRDWTAGCIAVPDRKMEEIYSMVTVGTQIDIHP